MFGYLNYNLYYTADQQLPVMLPMQQLRSVVPIVDHIKPWIVYYLLALFFNTMGPYPVDIVGYTAYFALVVGCFYLLVWILRKYQTSTEMLSLAGVVLLIFVVGALMANLLIYGFLPMFGTFLYDRNVPFHPGAFLQNAFRNFLPVLVAAIAYHQSRMKAAKNRQLLVAQHQYVATVQDQLRLERAQRKVAEENLAMQSSLITHQRGSHWLHGVFNHVKASLVHNESASRIVEAYISALRYLYEHGNHKSGVVLLAVEIDFIRKILFLNKVAMPDATEPELIIGEHLVAREIPQLVLATMIENALRYADQYDADHPIRIEITSDADGLRFSCWNKKKNSPEKATESTAVGLANIQRQLDLNFPDAHTLDIVENDDYFYVKLDIDFDL